MFSGLLLIGAGFLTVAILADGIPGLSRSFDSTLGSILSQGRVTLLLSGKPNSD